MRLIQPSFVERVWGTESLAPLFPDQGRKIGEVWFDAGPAFPLLIKFLFTSAKLSVQVHPGDEYAREVENSRGKTEMWHILSAAPDSTIALGFRERITKDQLRAAVEDGTVEQLLNWVPVKAGDTFFAGAGTVHAIGAGITLCEIQQNSDVTYRLYDYRRPRELHLEKGLAVCDTGLYEGRRDFPVMCEHFNTALLEASEPREFTADCESALIFLEGSGSLDGTLVRAGQVAVLSADSTTTLRPQEPVKLLHVRSGSYS